ncbi:MAG: OmpA family protein [Thioalkalivibrionaceae bacterium]
MLRANRPAVLLATAIAVSALALGGCTATNPETGGPSRAAIGAGIGAVSGAVLGNVASSRNRTRNTMIGAGIGAVAGGVVGNYMDQQEAELRRELAGTGVEVDRVGDDLVLNMPGQVTFDTNSTVIKPQFDAVVARIADVLVRYESTGVEVAGHTDSTGNLQYNMDLSQRRADSVAHALRVRGVNPSRIHTIGYGPQRPIASNDTPAGREQNRRVEMTLFALTQG